MPHTVCPVCNHIQVARPKYDPCAACGFAGVVYLFTEFKEAEDFRVERTKRHERTDTTGRNRAL